MNDYVCPNGHKFQSKAAIRAFCPECGESVKRTRATSISSGKDDDSTKNADTKGKSGGDNANGNAEGEKPESNKESEKEPPKKKEPVRTKVIRVKRKEPDEVAKSTKKTKTESKDGEEDTGRSKLIKRRKIRQKYRHPTVKGKVKTNKETQDEKTQGNKRLTHWEIFRKRAGFGG